MGNTRREVPAALTVKWPDTASADMAGETARRFANNLRAAMGKVSMRRVAADAGLDDGTLRRVLAGSVWPDLHTIARLEEALAVELYPRR